MLKKFILFCLIAFTNASELKNKYDVDLDFPELKYVDESVNPCDNFYKFSCGNFEKFNPLPPNEPLWDNFKIAQAKSDAIVKAVLNSPSDEKISSSLRKAKDMYYACVNPYKAAEQTINPLFHVIDELGGWPLISQVPRMENNKFSWKFIGELTGEYGLPFFLNFGMMPDFENPSIYMLRLGRDSLSLPSTAITYIEDNFRDFLRPEDKILSTIFRNETSRPVYLQYLIDLSLKFIREDYRPLFIDEIIKGCEKVFQLILQIRNSETYPFGSKYADGMVETIGELQEWSDEFSINFTTRIIWEDYFNGIFQKTGIKITKDTKVYGFQYDLLIVANILYIVETTAQDTLINFVFSRLFTFMAPDVNMEMWDDFNDLNRKLNYTVYSRDDYCLRKVVNYPNIGLSLAVAYEVQNYYFDLRELYKPMELIDNVMEAFFELLEEKDWMDDDARKWVRTKADAMLRFIGFPDISYNQKELDDYYKSLQICRHDHFKNSQNVRVFNYGKNIGVFDKPRNRYTWSQSPLVVNAYYFALNNRITFPAAIMFEPFFTGKSKLVDYSRIGALIGHEITHGFDKNGRNSDGEGNYVTENAWNENVTNEFNLRSDCITNQYSKYFIEEIGEYVIGENTNQENVADNGGIREAFRAFQKIKNNTKFTQTPSSKYTIDQLFFISYATMWCKVDTQFSLAQMQEKDNHAPNRFRVIGTLSNMQEFADTFNCPIGSTMNPVNKCVLW